MQKGMRARPAAGKKQEINNMKVEMQNMQMAMRVSQMMMQQLLSQIQKLGQDVQNASAIANNLDYRTLAMLEQLTLDKTKLEASADALKLIDYNEMSDKEDAEKNYAVTDVIEEDSIVIITSEAEGGKGVFRSKFRLGDAMTHLQEALKGKKVGDKVPAKLNNADHLIEIVGIRKPPATENVEQVNVEASAEDEQAQTTH